MLQQEELARLRGQSEGFGSNISAARAAAEKAHRRISRDNLAAALDAAKVKDEDASVVYEQAKKREQTNGYSTKVLSLERTIVDLNNDAKVRVSREQGACRMRS